ncbi:MAG: hypothetical protein MHM6MM_006973 [Cercozoa sp. M6MM]
MSTKIYAPTEPRAAADVLKKLLCASKPADANRARIVVTHIIASARLPFMERIIAKLMNQPLPEDTADAVRAVYDARAENLLRVYLQQHPGEARGAALVTRGQVRHKDLLNRLAFPKNASHSIVNGITKSANWGNKDRRTRRQACGKVGESDKNLLNPKEKGGVVWPRLCALAFLSPQANEIK